MPYYKPYSEYLGIFKYRPVQWRHYEDKAVKWQLLTEYAKKNFITRDEIYTLIKRRILAVSSFRNRLYVRELCDMD